MDINYDEVHGPRAYDEDGNTVECEWCGAEIIIKNGEYYCPRCEEVWSRKKFFDYIGSQPPGPECINCDNDYPSCGYCHHGYLKEDN